MRWPLWTIRLLQNIKDESQRHPWKTGLFALCILLLVAIEGWDYFSPLTTHDFIATNLEKISISRPDDFQFAVFGDNKNSYAAFEKILTNISNDQDIFFVIGLGDLVYDSEKEKYRYFLNQVRNTLTLPLLTVIGNHELYDKGRGLYYETFGPFYYSFHIGRNYFIVLDDADEKGLDVWQKRWLEAELEKAQQYDTRLVFMHVPLFDPRENHYHHCLPKRVGNELAALFHKYRVTHIFASHIHGYFSGHWYETPYTITGGAGAELWGIDKNHYFYHYLKVHVKDGDIRIEVRPIPSPDYEWFDRLAFIGWLYVSAFLRFHGIEIALVLLGGAFFIMIWRARERQRC